MASASSGVAGRIVGWTRIADMLIEMLSEVRSSLAEMAEGEGFEPPVRFPVQRFSRPPVSTAHPFLRCREYYLRGGNFQILDGEVLFAARFSCGEVYGSRNRIGMLDGYSAEFAFAFDFDEIA